MSLIVIVCLLLALLLFYLSGPTLALIGSLPVVDDSPETSDAVVVLYTGVEYYPRLIEAARLYNAGFAKTVVINGNRKSEVLRMIEKKGFEPGCHWAEDYMRILGVYGVLRSDIVAIDAEDAFDTISEANIVGTALLARNVRSILLTTSKSHTRRAKHIWRALFEKDLRVLSISAKQDPYSPADWWRSGRQIRWVMAEYGAWVYYWWQSLSGRLTPESEAMQNDRAERG